MFLCGCYEVSRNRVAWLKKFFDVMDNCFMYYFTFTYIGKICDFADIVNIAALKGSTKLNYKAIFYFLFVHIIRVAN